MIYSSLFFILTIAVCIISSVIAILVLQNNRKAHANRCFFALIASVVVWSAGLALATPASDAETSEIWRRVSALGWGTFYGIVLHFILIITGRRKLLNKWWFYILLYFPAAIIILAFAVPSGINPMPYQLHRTEFGWSNIAVNNIWDFIFYIYYISYIITSLVLVLRWGQKSSDKNIKTQSRIIFFSFVSALVLATITDVLMSTWAVKLPQMAPIIMLIPITAIYYAITKYGFIVSGPITNKAKYLNIIICIILYIGLTFLLSLLSRENITIKKMNIEPAALRGIIANLQMFILVYLVIKEDKPGYVAAILLNSYGIILAIIFVIVNASTAPIPGIMNCMGVFLVIVLIIGYKKETFLHIKKIEDQSKSLEESEKKLQRMAFYDSLTGLPNKALFINRLDQAIIASQRNASLIGVMYIDLDSFKSVNDTMGHNTGDLVLIKIAERLSSCLRKEDTISRFAGDEFLIQIANLKKVENIYKITNKIMNAFKSVIRVNNSEFFITPSIGVSVYPVDGEDSETLIKNADIAMYAAKNNGKNQCVYCSSEMKDDIIKNMKLANSLYRALDKNELFIYYQPQLKTDTQEIIGFEALLRWKHNEYGMVPPSVFIPIAEKTGLIKPIGLWVIKTVCEQLKDFINRENKEIRISVNLSVEQLKDDNIARQISKILEETQTDAKNIQIEITESVAFDKEPYVLHRIKELKNLGISISIDDFGTGHSSISRLKAFPIDLIKIDMEFVRGISSESKKDKAIIKSIIQIAKNLGIKVLAEGVETEEQFNYLKKKKCDEIQGYYFYKPMPLDEIKAIIAGRQLKSRTSGCNFA